MPGDTAWTNATAPLAGYVLRPDEFATAARRVAVPPCSELARHVEHYWSVEWDLAPDTVFPVATLSEPAPHVTVERGGVARAGITGPGYWFTGPISRGRFDVTLRASGSVVGVKFALGGVLAFCSPNLRALRDRTVTAHGVIPEPPPLPGSAEEAARALDRWLLGLGPRPVDGRRELERLLALLNDSQVTSVELLAQRSGFSARAIQRLFHRLVGVGPKRLILRARVRDAVAALDRGHPASLADLAHGLGWYDQAHFIRDFRAAVGCSPSAYVQRVGEDAGWAPDLP